MRYFEKVLRAAKGSPLFEEIVEEKISADPRVARLARFYADNFDKEIPSQVLQWEMSFVDGSFTVPAYLFFSVGDQDATETQVLEDLFQLISLLDFPTVEISVWMNSSSFNEFLDQDDHRRGTVRYYPREEARKNFDLFAQEFFAVLNQNRPFSDPGISERNVWSFKMLKVRVFDVSEHVIHLSTSRDTKRFASLELNGYAWVENAPPIKDYKKSFGIITKDDPDGNNPYIQKKNREIYHLLKRAVTEGIFSYETLTRYEIMTQLGGESL